MDRSEAKPVVQRKNKNKENQDIYSSIAGVIDQLLRDRGDLDEATRHQLLEYKLLLSDVVSMKTMQPCPSRLVALAETISNEPNYQPAVKRTEKDIPKLVREFDAEIVKQKTSTSAYKEKTARRKKFDLITLVTKEINKKLNDLLDKASSLSSSSSKLAKVMAETEQKAFANTNTSLAAKVYQAKKEEKATLVAEVNNFEYNPAKSKEANKDYLNEKKSRLQVLNAEQEATKTRSRKTYQRKSQICNLNREYLCNKSAGVLKSLQVVAEEDRTDEQRRLSTEWKQNFSSSTSDKLAAMYIKYGKALRATNTDVEIHSPRLPPMAGEARCKPAVVKCLCLLPQRDFVLCKIYFSRGI